MAKVLTNLVFKSSTPILDEESDFPASPEFGQFCFKGGVLYIYAIIDTVETWFPLTNRNQHFIHTQAISSTSWVINHALQSSDLIFMAYDETDTQMTPSDITFDNDNQITLSFTEAEQGKAVVFAASEQFVPAVQTTELNVGNDITMSGTSITVGGTDIVQLINQVNSDLYDMFSWNETQGEITFKGDLIPENTNSLSIGSPTKKVKDFYVSAETVYVGDNARFEGTALSIDAGPNPTSIADNPTVLASSLILKPFTYNPGAGDINVEPVLKFQNLGGQQYGISFNLMDNEFQLDSPSGVGTGALKAQNLTVNNKITADTLELVGTEQVQIDQNLRVDGDVTLGYDNNNDVVIRGSVDLQTPITFSEGAQLGDGNDNISINCGLSNQFTVVATNLSVSGAGKITAAEIESDGNLTVGGDLFVNGTQTVVNTTTLEVTDNEVVVNNGEAGAGITAGSGGLRIDRGSLPDAVFIFDDSDDSWKIGIDGSLSSMSLTNHDHDSDYLRTDADSQPNVDNVHEIGTGSFRFANIFSTEFTGHLTGNADTAAKLATPRTIRLLGDATGSATFDGSGDADITATVANDSHTHDGRYYTESEQDTRFLRRDADSTPSTNGTLSLGSSSYKFSQVFANNFKGVADEAAKWQNSRTITLQGDLSGSVAIDGSGDVNLTAAVLDDSHNHDGRYYTESEANDAFVNVNGDTMAGNLTFPDSDMIRLGTGNDLDIFHDGSDSYLVNHTGFLALRSTSGENGIVIRPNAGVDLYYDNSKKLGTSASGIEVTGTITGTLNGNANTASAWQSTRTLSLTGDVVGSVDVDGSGNMSMDTVVANDSHNHDSRYYTETEADAKYFLKSGGTISGATTVESDFVVSANQPQVLLKEADTDTWGRLVFAGSTMYMQAGANGQSGAGSGNIVFTGYNATDLGTLRVRKNGSNYDIWNAYNHGAGSGMDADTVDGLEANQFLRSDANDSTSGFLTMEGAEVSGGADKGLFLEDGKHHITSNDGGGNFNIRVGNTYSAGMTENGYGGHQVFAQDTGNWTFNATNASQSVGESPTWATGLQFNPGSGAITWKGNNVWHAGNDGAGTGLDADTVDSLQASQFLRSDADDSTSGNLTISSAANNYVYINRDGGIEITRDTGSPFLDFKSAGTEDYDCRIVQSSNGLEFYTGGNGSASNALLLNSDQTVTVPNGRLTAEEGFVSDQSAPVSPENSNNWGPGISVTDGGTGTTVAPEGYCAVATLATDTITRGFQLSAGDDALYYRRLHSSLTSLTWDKVWSESNDGADSGLDADKVDGVEAAKFLRTDVSTGPDSDNAISLGDATHRFTEVHAVTVSGTASEATYADLAEILTCEEDVVYPGTVMKACETGDFDVEECGTEYARNIIGVVSENPAYLMNSDEEGVAVAYTGKVRVRVKGPVGKGQPLVPAGEGVARGIRKDAELLYSFGTTLEANEEAEEKLIMCIIK